MTIRIFRLFTLVLAALTLSLSFCHLMEMPVRMKWDAELWVGTTVSGNVFQLFGSVGAVTEVGAVLATIGLAAVVWRQGKGVRIAACLAAVLFALAFGYLWFAVFPANRELASWLTGQVPSDWFVWRARWEYGHAVRAVLHLTGFILLSWSAVAASASESHRQLR